MRLVKPTHPLSELTMATTPITGAPVRRTLKIADPLLAGEDVAALQRALNARLKARRLSPLAVDGAYGPTTHAVALDVAWQLGIGLSIAAAQPLSPMKQKLIRSPRMRNPTQLKRARLRRGKLPPGAVARPLSTPVSATSEFTIVEPEGAPARDGRRFHAAKDWFAAGGSLVRSPVPGQVIHVAPSNVDVGQVFGGVVKIQAADGKVWVFRHVVPQLSVGQRVRAGQLVATVTHWRSGMSHTHIELWKSHNGGVQVFENMIDPMIYLRRFA
jgi:murein DD-endopeptidase MepM/ murein hydrolase activator NlpD